MDDFERIGKLQKKIEELNLDAFIITNPTNIFYLTGINNFDAEKGFLLLVQRNKWLLISSLFYQNRIDGIIAAKNIAYVDRGDSISERMSRETKNEKIIGFEREDISFARYEIFKKALRGKKFLPIGDIIEQFRKIKTAPELALVKKAAAITDKTFTELLKIIKPGVTELSLRRKILEIMQDMGAQSGSFDPIVASGKSGADPHYEGSNKRIKNGEMIVIDMGARYKNYDADMTRMVFMGKATEKYKKLYQIVLETQENALKDCKIGVDVKIPFDNAVKNFKRYTEDQYFTHGLGHGVGINIHELPNLSPAGDDKFENGMVFTVEPGIYHLGWGGIRIEDLCSMEDGKIKILSKTPKDLIEL